MFIRGWFKSATKPLAVNPPLHVFKSFVNVKDPPTTNGQRN